MESFNSPTNYHLVNSPLIRPSSRSDVRTGPPRLRTRSQSFTSLNTGGFTLPSYGYGGGYMSKTLSRSNSTLTLFGRSLHSTALDKTTPFHNVAVQRATPHYSDKYPYVRYSYGNVETGLGLLTQTEMKNPNYIGVRDAGTKRWLQGKLNIYNTGIFTRPPRNNYIERPITPRRDYVKFMPMDNALDMFKKKCMTAGTLSRYWLQSSSRSKETGTERFISTPLTGS